MSQRRERVIRKLVAETSITEEEARTLGTDQAEEILGIFHDAENDRLTTDEMVARLDGTGYWDLPSIKGPIEEYVHELKSAELRAMFDMIAAEDLAAGKPMSTARMKKDDGAYPPPRSN
jgi:hypothetical protein